VARLAARFHFADKKILLARHIHTDQDVDSSFLRLQRLHFQCGDLLQHSLEFICCSLLDLFH
jgi:hypothetical protein